MSMFAFIPQRVFEMVGVAVGMMTCGVILYQLIKEYRDRRPSSMGVTYVMGWLVIFLFWLLYGLRFEAVAIVLTNAVASVLQAGLLAVILHKRRMLKR